MKELLLARLVGRRADLVELLAADPACRTLPDRCDWRLCAGVGSAVTVVPCPDRACRDIERA